MQQVLTILGSTGSIGTNTLQVVALHPDKYRIFALTGQNNATRMLQQCIEFQPQLVVMTGSAAALELQQKISQLGLATQVLNHPTDLAFVAQHPQVTTVMSAIVGAAGLAPTFAAARAGKRILLANKEAIVIGANLLFQTAAAAGAKILPIDSEHSAIFQALPVDKSCWQQQIDKLILTASGGAFLRHDLADFVNITPEQACNHPNFSMGKKITVDSATMVNKALEVIEAKYLFGVQVKQIEVLIHPQQVIHSMVQYKDSSVIAQLGASDMRIPISYGLAYPARVTSGVKPLDFTKIGALTFEKPTPERYPAFNLVWQVLAAQDGSTIVYNAANEVAVAAFLAQQIGFLDIFKVIEQTLEQFSFSSPTSLAEIEQLNSAARQHATKISLAVN